MESEWKLSRNQVEATECTRNSLEIGARCIDRFENARLTRRLTGIYLQTGGILRISRTIYATFSGILSGTAGVV